MDAMVSAERLGSLHLGGGATVAVRYDGLRLISRFDSCCLLFGSACRTEVDGPVVVALQGVMLNVISGHVGDVGS